MEHTLAHLTQEARLQGKQHAIFVYGTLMRGQRASHMLDEAVFCGQFILRNHAMYNLGRYPGIRPFPGGQVMGEVYFISDHMLPQMDEYEEEGSLYHRKKVQVEQDGTALDAWAYIYAHEINGTPMNKMWGAE